jgi:hypothetical protein
MHGCATLQMLKVTLKLSCHTCARPSAADTATHAYASWSDHAHKTPKWPRVECGDLTKIDRSASVLGGVTSVTEKTTLSMRSNALRSSCQQRQLIWLRTAPSPICLHPLAAAGEYIPAAVAPRARTLQTYPRHWRENEYTPACLSDALEQNPMFKVSLLFVEMYISCHIFIHLCCVMCSLNSMNFILALTFTKDTESYSMREI